MPNEPDGPRQWDQILESLSEAVIDASDEELLEEVLQDGESPAEIAAGVRKLLLGGVLDHYKMARTTLENQVKTEDVLRAANVSRLPSSAQHRRNLLSRVLAAKPKLATFRHRDFSEYSDADIESDLRKLEALGLLEEFFGDGEE